MFVSTEQLLSQNFFASHVIPLTRFKYRDPLHGRLSNLSSGILVTIGGFGDFQSTDKHTSMSPFSQIAYWKSFFQGDGYSHDQIPDLTGKVVIVTGANSGLGYATTVVPAAHGARASFGLSKPESTTGGD
ncbi:hypothetical protein KI688_012569 [Linnemannia hyalina]|uniref:Uncharacterized protein n=1 Tax=Linnemannia hyalina TaxID=64524 RepID=A0A9P7XVT1_9FUNG|nr:hypothetical protein KI688_012569 [Linnemannia hyalina]